jgi:hypothetical protein
MRWILLTLIGSLLISTAAAGQASGLETGPGFVTPDSPVYGLEVAIDNAAVSIGLMDAGSVAQERAAEAVTMQETGDHQAAIRAASAAGKAVSAAKTGGGNTTGIDTAIDTLQQVKRDAPPEAQDGLNTAIDSLKRARDIINSTVPPGGGSNGTPVPSTPPTPSPPTNGTPGGSDSISTSLSTSSSNGDITVDMAFSADEPYTLRKNITHQGGDRYLFRFTFIQSGSGATSHSASLSRDFGSSSYTVEARAVVDGEIKSRQTVSGT